MTIEPVSPAPQVPVGPIDWGVLEPGQFEGVVSVMLMYDRPSAQRRRSSRGDAGVDVYTPVDGGYEVFQLKRFARNLTARRKALVEESLASVIDDAELGAPVVRWHLVAPVNLSKEAHVWFAGLAESAPFQCDWWGATRLEVLASQRPAVVEYYFGQGAARLEAHLRDLRNVHELLAPPHAPVRPTEATPAIVNLFEVVNREDPHYRYEFEVSAMPPDTSVEVRRPGMLVASTAGGGPGGCVTWRVFPRYPQAVEDRPPGGVDLEVVGAKAIEALQEALSYGDRIEIADPDLGRINVRAPGGLGGEFGGGRIIIGPQVGEGLPSLDLTLVAGDAEVSAHAIERGGQLPRFRVRMRAEAGAFDVTLRADGAAMSGRLEDFELNVVGKPVEAVLPALRFLANVRAPETVEVRLGYGPRRPMFTFTPHEADGLIYEGYLEVVEALADIQQEVAMPVRVFPDEWMTDPRALRIVEVAKLIRGERIDGTWSPGHVEINPEHEEEALRAIVEDQDSVVVLRKSLVLDLFDGPIELGIEQTTFERVRRAGTRRSETGSLIVDLVPGANDHTHTVRLVDAPGDSDAPEETAEDA